MQETAVVSPGGAGFRHALSDRLLRKITMAVLFAAGYEVAVSSWLVYVLEQGVGVSPAFAAAAIGVFFAGLAVGRASGSWLARTGRLHALLRPLAILQSILALLSLILMDTLPWLFALAGLTSSVFFPTLFYKVAHQCPLPASGAVYLTGAGLGVSLFPFLVGVAGDLLTIRWALVAAVFCAIMLVPALIAIERHEKKLGQETVCE
jgi:fucose permease